MGFMIDTVSYLDQIRWSDLQSWKGEYPLAAGRYFGGGYSWSGTEFTSAKASTGQVLTRVAPIRASEPADQATSGTPGHNLGISAAHDTIARINNAIDQGQLAIPPAGNVIIYLDVEPGTMIEPAFWAGFANTVNTHTIGPDTPFTAGIYTQFVANPSGLYLPQATVQRCLDTAYANWPDVISLCAGFWSANPSASPSESPVSCAACSDPTYTPNWDVFEAYSQPYEGATFPIPIYLWQYAELQVCTGSKAGDCNHPGFAGGQPVDFDSTGTTGAANLMLEIA
jgi:hypothetical protein